MPRPLEFHTQNHRSVCLPCVGVVPRAANGNLYDCRWQSYRYYVAALLGSRRGCTVGSCKRLSNDSLRHIGRLHPLSHGLRPVTAPPTQGSLWLVQTGSPYFDFYDSVIVSWRTRHASPLQCPAGRYLKSPHSRYHKNPPAGGISLTGGSFYCILSHLCRFRSFFSRF